MKKIVVFTAGFHARATFRHLARQRDCRVVAFVDNNPAMQGRALFGVQIVAPRQLAMLDFDLVAVPGRNQKAIVAQLRDELRIEAPRIWLVNKSEVRPAADELERRGGDLVRLLRQTTAVLDAAGSEYWAMHSGLLGLMRGQELALFSDLDLCVATDGFEALEVRFRREGLSVTSVHSPDDGSLVQVSLQMKPAQDWDEPAMIDLHPIAVGPVEATWPVNLRPLSMPSAFFRGYSTLPYRGLHVRVPVRANDVLTELYGPDWRRPAETWNGCYALASLAASECVR